MAMRPKRKSKNDPTLNAKAISDLVTNAMLSRTQLLTKLLDTRRDIDTECGYPKVVTPTQFKLLYDREGIATRVVNVFPEHSWAIPPRVVEMDDTEQTEFEKAWEDLQKQRNVFHYLERADMLSGIGYYGILLLGFDDGNDLNLPLEGIAPDGSKAGNQEHQLMYLLPFDDTQVTIEEYEKDPSNPRYGRPVSYEINLTDPRVLEAAGGQKDTLGKKTVHWNRVVHLADNRTSSEIFGVPRMRPVYNRLYDLRKVLGGSGEMFWKGGFPGLAFDVNPDQVDVTLDKEALRAEMDSYANGLQRWFATQGISAKSLTPQVADPEGHIKVQLQAIAITLGVPLRILMGSEQAQLASGQDKKTWNSRVSHRQETYLSPMVLRPFIDRLIAAGTLPEVETYEIIWPDLNSPTDQEKADIANTWTGAIAKYISGGVDALIPPFEYLTLVLGMPADQAEAVLAAASEQLVQTPPDQGPPTA